MRQIEGSRALGVICLSGVLLMAQAFLLDSSSGSPVVNSLLFTIGNPVGVDVAGRRRTIASVRLGVLKDERDLVTESSSSAPVLTSSSVHDEIDGNHQQVNNDATDLFEERERIDHAGDIMIFDDNEEDDHDDQEWSFSDDNYIGADHDESILNSDVLNYARDEDYILTEREDRMYAYQEEREKEHCILVGCENLSYKRTSGAKIAEWESQHFSLEESLTEMRELIKTAGMTCVGEVTQRLNNPNPRTYVGTGKVKEIDELANSIKCSTVVFDAELTPGQQKQLENAFNKKILQNDFLGSVQDVSVLFINCGRENYMFSYIS